MGEHLMGGKSSKQGTDERTDRARDLVFSGLDAGRTALYLKGRGLGVDGALGLAEVLHRLPAVATVNLSANQLGDEGMRIACPALARGSSLKIVDLSDNLVGAGGAAALGSMLAESTFEELNLHGLGLTG